MRFEQITKVMARSLGISPGGLLENFQPAEAHDIELIVEFRKINFDEIFNRNDAEYLGWRYAFESESGQANAQNRVWLVKRDGQIIGMVGAQFMPVNVDGKILKGLHLMDLLVDKSIDGAGLGAWMQLALNERCEVMLIIGANEKSQSIVQRIFHPMPNRQAWKQVLDARPILAKHLQFGRFAAMLGHLVNPFLSLFRYIRSRDVRRMRLEMRELNTLPDNAQSIADSQSGNFIFCRKSADFLNWKFLKNPEIDYELYGFFQNGMCCGYIVCRRTPQGENTTSEVCIQDFFWLADQDCNAKLLKAILAETAGYFKKHQVHLIGINAYGDQCAAILSDLGFIQREENLVFSLSCNVSVYQQAIFDAKKWFLTEADAHGGGFV